MSSSNTQSPMLREIVDGIFTHNHPRWGTPEKFEVVRSRPNLMYHGGTWTAKSHWTRTITVVRGWTDGERMLSLVDTCSDQRTEFGDTAQLAGEPFEPTQRWMWFLSLANELKKVMPLRHSYFLCVYSEPRGDWVQLRAGTEEIARCSFSHLSAHEPLIAAVTERLKTM